MTNFYTSDEHWFHRNIIKYSKRPFHTEAGEPDVDAMNRALIKNILDTVSPTDRLYILGDVCFGNKREADWILDQLAHLNMWLISGNHDSDAIKRHPVWKGVSPLMEINDSGTHVVLCHFAMKVWNRSHYGAVNLHGHSHGSLAGNSQQVDVGVDCWDFKPVTLTECLDRMATLPPFGSGDHHRPRDQA